MTRFSQSLFIVAFVGLGIAAGAWILATEPAQQTGTRGQGDEAHRAEGHTDHEEEGHAEENHIKLTVKQVSAAGLGIEIAGPARLQKSVRISGAIVPNQERLIEVTPRFAGVVRSVVKRVGDPVAKGERLVGIESNESLTVYSILAPLTGTILARDAALGESVNTEKTLFVIADLSTVWIELGLHSTDVAQVKVGQTAMIRLGDAEPVPARITFVSPLTSAATQTVTARAVLENVTGSFRPGLFVTADVLTDMLPVAVAVKQEAIQEIDGKKVVFVRESEGNFVVREVELGERGGRMVEVLLGVVSGETYVTKNSFVLKAELGKATAEHSH